MKQLRLILALTAGLTVASGQGAASTTPTIILPNGPEEVIFNPKTDACDGYDVPDTPTRAFRDAEGNIRVFTLHFENRYLVGQAFNRLKINCKVAFRGNWNADPAAYDDKSWIAATWTADGKTVHGLAHHEYQGNAHAGRCVYRDYMPCWYNTILAVRSMNGGQTFEKAKKPVVASSPFEQNIGQGRHRGFFNPSNIVSDGVWHYMIASTTGWSGQNSGACLFRTDNIADATRWRAWNGASFETRFGDPYRKEAEPNQTCKPLPHFPAPVGSISRHRESKVWIATFQAQSDGKTYARSGIYVSTSSDLLTWSQPRLLMAAKTLYDSPCGANYLYSYPSLLDETAETRNFEDIGNAPYLYLSRMKVDGCKHTGDRVLVRIPLKIGIK